MSIKNEKKMMRLESEVVALRKALAEKEKECSKHLEECKEHLKVLDALQKENQLLKSKRKVTRRKTVKSSDKE
tara:strand:- start:285 stop:503 length:219 start_codon:yes stop_codon:yes gene_type:complete